MTVEFEALKRAEGELFALAADVLKSPSPIFIVAAPRTGSTVFYQAMAHAFSLPYIANITNQHFPQTPIVGLAIQKSVTVEIGMTSRYGKSDGPFQPSEGSAVMSHWFGGGHPSALLSARVLDGREAHMRSTLSAVEAMFTRPLLVKNAWNCFRIADLRRALPEARFVWLRRDIAAAARSDLAARWATKGTDREWNSATPANYEQLRQRPPVEQVVENQFEFNRAIGESLKSAGKGYAVDIWYEDFLARPADILAQVAATIGLPTASASMPRGIVPPAHSSAATVEPDSIDRYVASQGERLASACYPPASLQ